MPDGESLLPDGWEVEGYWTGLGEGHGSFIEVEGTMSPQDFMDADRIVLSYDNPDTDFLDYYTMGEVEDYDALYDYIDTELGHYF